MTQQYLTTVPHQKTITTLQNSQEIQLEALDRDLWAFSSLYPIMRVYEVHIMVGFAQLLMVISMLNETMHTYVVHSIDKYQIRVNIEKGS